MALKLAAPIPLFSPAPPPPRRCGGATELRFSRWNNANAEPFLRRQREQQEIEADIRRHRRHVSASRLADVSEEYPPLPSPPSAPAFKSVGTPSTPSSPSIPGKASKYSKPPLPPKRSNLAPRHPAFRRVSKTRITPTPDGETGISVGERGIVYKVKDAPFEFQYSYTETPKVKPIALREAPFLPFGPATTPRPWTGRAPLPASKKKLPEFDSFRLPPPGKKGVKPVQAPGPFLAGSGPRHKTATREEILGDPLTEEEVKDLINGCMKTQRQLNMGRDGLTHNMLDNIHAHWKRRRVCKIKCKGVCTVDMDNVRQQLEEKTGGKIIYSRGGVLFLFRGRNYNYRTRPRFPLMLWRPITPVYPRLIPQVPEGLTIEEVTEMRNRGRQLPPIQKLAKNGLYSNLVKLVREAFEACELVRVDCSGLHKSDCRKIGAKLKDLVPCVLISFEYEHILMWRGKDWKSSLPPVEDDQDKVVGSYSDAPLDAPPTISSSTTVPLLNPEGEPDLHAEKNEVEKADLETTTETMIMVKDVNIEGNENLLTLELGAGKSRIEEFDYEKSTRNVTKLETASVRDSLQETSDSGSLKGLIEHPSIDIHSQIMLPETSDSEHLKDVSFREREARQLTGSSNASSMTDTDGAVTRVNGIRSSDELDTLSKEISGCDKCLDGVLLLLSQAVENGSAVVLNEEASDADIVFKRSVALAKTAPPGPVFEHTIRKSRVKSTGKNNEEKGEGCKEKDLCVDLSTLDATEKRDSEKRKFKGQKREDFRESFSDVVPHGSLRVDELARLLT